MQVCQLILKKCSSSSARSFSFSSFAGLAANSPQRSLTCPAAICSICCTSTGVRLKFIFTPAWRRAISAMSA